MLEEIQETEVATPDKIKKKWRAKIESKTLETSDLITYFQISAPYFLQIPRKNSATSENSKSTQRMLSSFEYHENCENSQSLYKEETQRESFPFSE